jgi:mannan endo-1,4-beta-mannosidase
MRFIFLLLLLLPSQLFSNTLYDGETRLFGGSVKWDSNGSIMNESQALPFSPPNHLRASLVNVNYWGASGYVLDRWKPVNFITYHTLNMVMRSDNNATVGIQLFDALNKSSLSVKVDLSYSHELISIPIQMFSGVDLTKITAIIFSVSTQKAEKKYLVDIDDIAIDREITPPDDDDIDPPDTGVMQTKGRSLYDACKKKVVLRGVNHMTCYTDWVGTPRDGMPMYQEIAKTGANAVRIVWTYSENTTAAELDRAITNAAKNRLIPMVEILDQTCEWSKAAFDKVLAWWLQPDIIKVMKKHEKYVLLNFANEMGNGDTNVDNYKSEYRRVIEKMRGAGLKSTIVIDAPGCGQNETIMLAAAQYLIDSDPLKNIMMSLHLWWVPQEQDRITAVMTQAKNLNIPLVIGEFAGVAVDCKTPTFYSHLLKIAQDTETGWMPWSWDKSNGCQAHSMTKDDTYSGLFGYGKDVAIDDPNSIKNTSVQSTCF